MDIGISPNAEQEVRKLVARAAGSSRTLCSVVVDDWLTGIHLFDSREKMYQALSASAARGGQGCRILGEHEYRRLRPAGDPLSLEALLPERFGAEARVKWREFQKGARVKSRSTIQAERRARHAQREHDQHRAQRHSATPPPPRKPTPAPIPPPKTTQSAQRRARLLARVVNESLSVGQIAEELGVSDATARKDVAALGDQLEVMPGSTAPVRYRVRRRAV